MLGIMESQKELQITEKKQNKSHLFQPGQSGNPKGKKKGTLNKFTRLKNDVLEAIETRKEELKALAFDKLLTIGASFVPKNDKGKDGDERIVVVVNNNRADGKDGKNNRIKVLPTSESTEDSR